MVKQGGLVLVLLLSALRNLYTAENCLNNPCQNEGICVLNHDEDYMCKCKYGWYGNNCELRVKVCKPELCKNDGICKNKDSGRYECVCTTNYIGENCEFSNPCVNNPCKNKGICKPLLNGHFNCICSKYFIGDYCEKASSSCPEDITRRRTVCSRHGECKSRDGKLYCSCDSGYFGPKCQTRGFIEIGCKDGFCLNGGKCLARINEDPFCICNNGYSGKQCNIQNKNLSNPKHIKNPILEKKPQLTTIMSKHVPINKDLICNPECKSLKNNGKCDQRCNTPQCQYDGGDCNPWNKCHIDHCQNVFRNDHCNPECNNVNCLFDGQDCDSSSCINLQYCTRVYQNNICNEICNNPQCGFDGGDCQNKHSDSFFSNVGNIQKCFSDKRKFELDLILLTTMENFLRNKAAFLQTLGSALKMVLTISEIRTIKFNSTTALSIKLSINPTECIIYGGQCFSSLEQISNFIKAGMNSHGALSLPFTVANVESKTIHAFIPQKPKNNAYFVFLLVISSALIISLIVIGVLLRDKWGRLRTKVKTAGVWTPSEGYSTSTSSINSNQKSGWSASLQRNNFKLDHRFQSQSNYENDIFKHNIVKISTQGKNIENPIDGVNRKRKYDIIDPNRKALSFQLISEHLQKRDGINPVNSTQAKLISIINEYAQQKNDPIFEERGNASTDLGSYVNEDGESLLHIAARMNCGSNIIKKLHNISPSMLHSTDEWGRTPLAVAVASDALESVEQLLLLEKQSRKEWKQNKMRIGQNMSASCGTLESPVKKTTGLIEAVKLNSKEMINLLLDEGCPVNVLDSNGRSVVHWAAIFNNVALLERLSHMKIFQKLVDLKDNEELSPLYLAANEGSFDSAKFIVEYIRKLGIKIDHIFPCPKAIAAEKGFPEIETLINEAELPNAFSEKAYKRIKLKDQKMIKKLSSLNSSAKPLGIINEYNEYSADSIKLDKNSPSGIDSLESCLLDMYSLEDSSLNNILDSCSSDKNHYSSFKPQDNNCHSYLSNTSSSDMSPPLLCLKNPSVLNCYNYQTDQLDPTLQNAFFLSPTQIPQTNIKHMINNNVMNSHDTSLGLYHLEPSSRTSQHQHRSLNMISLPSVNCPQ